MGCVPSCPTLDEGMLRHHAATRRLTVLELLPPRPTSNMEVPVTVSDHNHGDNALQERIRINGESMAHIKTMVNLRNTLIPTISSAFTMVDKQPPPVLPMYIPSSIDTGSGTDNVGMFRSDSPSSARDIRVLYSSLKSSYPGVGRPYYASSTTSIDTFIPSSPPNVGRSTPSSTQSIDSDSSSRSTTAIVPLYQKTCSIPQSMSCNPIPKPLPIPPRARIREGGVKPSHTSPAILPQGGAVDTSMVPFRTPPFGRYPTLPERAKRLAEMRKEALAVVEARGREAIDKMVAELAEIDDENEVRQTYIEAPVWI